MLRILTVLFTLFSYSLLAQEQTPPIYKNCTSTNVEQLESCFKEQIKKDFLANFNLPNSIKPSFKERIIVYFNISTDGNYHINYSNATSIAIKNEIKRVFNTLPKSKAATFNGRTIESNYILPFLIPIQDNYTQAQQKIDDAIALKMETKKEKELFKRFPETNSSLTIPFTHQEYDALDEYYNMEDNNHTAVKPYFYNKTASYKKIANQKQELFKDTEKVSLQKIWNANLFTVKTDDYWFTVNPILDWQLGKDNSTDVDYTYNNTRAINVKGGLGKFSFSTSYYESQGRFASYINKYTRTLNPAFGYAVVPGRGLAKKFKSNSFDYPVAEAYLAYSPNKHFNFQFGNGKNFIGDGYRSLLLSDVAAPYTFAKISTQFWKIKYTNLWMWLDDVRPSAVADGKNLRKYVASHHLSINITPKFNIGLFESTITKQINNESFDVNFLNPIIFYRAVEYTRGSRSGNAIVGLNSKYQLNKDINFYGQFVLDELAVGHLFKFDGWWANKFGVQIGAHYYNAFGVANLMFQLEANAVRPFTYGHNDSEKNYAHYYQPLAHPWGGNFGELIGIARYRKNRWFGNAKLVVGRKGFDFDDSNVSFGGNIFESSTDRVSTLNNTFFQGNTATIINTDLQIGYLINPSTNLQAFGNLNYRHFKSKVTIPYFNQENTLWFSVGLKTDIFNSYLDF